MNDPSVYEEIGRFDSDYRPSDSFNTLPSTQDLAEGIYACTIRRQEVSRTKSVQTPCFRLILSVSRGSGEEMLVEHFRQIGTQDDQDRLGAELIALGIDADQWTAANGRPFSREFAKLVQSNRLIGLRFQARRRSFTKTTGGTGWAFDISGLLKPASKPSAAPAPTAAPAPRNHQPQPAGAPAARPASPEVDDEEIPF